MNAAARLRAIKLAHTLIWAFFAGCVLALPLASALGAHRLAALLAGAVALEVLVLAFNRLRCPLTALAARYTDDRRPNFDIYLPVWLARNNQRIFGSLYFAGLGFALLCWLRDGGGF
jgi:hypothetical protein